jgi:peptidyl-prolyl cis-trans isomerase B (cyclophilin B)
MDTKTIIILVITALVIVGGGYYIWKNYFTQKTPKIESFENSNITDYFNSTYKPYFDIQIGNEPIKRVVFQLFDEDVPKTCRNFRYLCVNNIVVQNDQDQEDKAPKKSSYDNTTFHRVIKDFMIQGGDITNGDGTGGYSMYGGKFNDENFNLKHNQPGILSMANSGSNTNNSQFFITTNETPWLDGKHVVFGIVIDGYDLIEKIQNIECDSENKPLIPVTIVKSGLI